MATPQVYAAAIEYFTAHQGEPGISLRTIAMMDEFPGVTKDSLSRRMKGRVLIDAKPGPRPKITIAQAADFKADVQRGMHSNAVTIAAAAAKLGAYASSNEVPYIDGVPCKRSVLHFFNDNDLGIAKARLMRTGRIKQYDWAKLEPAYLKLGEIFAKHPILLEEPQRIANMDEKPLSSSSEKVGNGKEEVVYDKSVPFVPGMVTGSLSSDVPHVTFVPTVLGDGTKLKAEPT
jgi:hypothetical protein